MMSPSAAFARSGAKKRMQNLQIHRKQQSRLPVVPMYGKRRRALHGAD